MQREPGLIVESRQSERVDSVMPVYLQDGDAGMTRDLSPAGLYFLADRSFEPGQLFSFTLEFANPGARLWLRALGRVMRVEDRAGRYGIAAKITESRLEREASAA